MVVNEQLCLGLDKLRRFLRRLRIVATWSGIIRLYSSESLVSKFHLLLFINVTSSNPLSRLDSVLHVSENLSRMDAIR